MMMQFKVKVKIYAILHQRSQTNSGPEDLTPLTYTHVQDMRHSLCIYFCFSVLFFNKQTNMEGLTSLGHVQGCLFPNTSVGSSDEDCFPFQPGLAPTHSSCHPSAEGQHAYPWQKRYLCYEQGVRECSEDFPFDLLLPFTLMFILS